MEKKKANTEVIKSIHKLAHFPEKVRITKTAKYDLMARDLTKADACDAIIKWIDEGKEVKEIITEHVSGHIGEINYFMKPILREQIFYVKVSLFQDSNGENMLIISAHVDH